MFVSTLWYKIEKYLLNKVQSIYLETREIREDIERTEDRLEQRLILMERMIKDIHDQYVLDDLTPDKKLGKEIDLKAEAEAARLEEEKRAKEELQKQRDQQRLKTSRRSRTSHDRDDGSDLLLVGAGVAAGIAVSDSGGYSGDSGGYSGGGFDGGGFSGGGGDAGGF